MDKFERQTISLVCAFGHNEAISHAGVEKYAIVVRTLVLLVPECKA